MLPPLIMDDFKDRHIDPNWSPFQMLLEIAEVEEQKLQQLQRSSDSEIHVSVGVAAKDNNSKKADEPNPVGVAVAEANNTRKKRRRVRKFKIVSNSNVYDHGGITVEADSKNSEPNPVAEISKELIHNERSLCLEKKPNNETLRIPNHDDNNGKRPLVLKLKRSVVVDDDDDGEDYWVSSSSMKAKNESIPSTSNSNPRLNRQYQLPPPPLAKEFMMKKINELGGTEITLLIQKSLFWTDLSQQHNRLSMPIKQMKTDETFLRESELQLLKIKENQDEMVVPLLQPSSLNVWESKIILARWKMNNISMYILRGTWFRMAKANDLKKNDVVQVWSFRVEGQLWMALIKL